MLQMQYDAEALGQAQVAPDQQQKLDNLGSLEPPQQAEADNKLLTHYKLAIQKVKSAKEVDEMDFDDDEDEEEKKEEEE